MDSKPFDYKKLDALLAAARDFLGCPVTYITLQSAVGGSTIRRSSDSAHITIVGWGAASGQVSWAEESLLKPDTEPNKNS